MVVQDRYYCILIDMYHTIFSQISTLVDYMSGDLIVYGAAYGPLDVGGNVRGLRKDNQITLIANNDNFGDSWHGTVNPRCCLQIRQPSVPS